MDILNIFNNRELATLTWIILFLGFCLWQPQIRRAMKDVVKAFFQKPIIICLTLFVLYVFSICSVLHMIDLWSFFNLKTTLFWFFGSGTVAIMNAQKATKDTNLFGQLLKDQLSILIIMEFIANFYSFSYWIELLILPVIAYLAMAMAYSEGKNEYKTVHNLLSWVLALYGLFLFSHGIYRAIHHYQDIINQPQMVELILVPVLSIATLPFVYFLALFMTYENLFIRIRFWTKDETLAKLAKRKLITTFNLNLNRLVAFSRKSGLLRIKSREDLNQIT